MKNTHKHGHPSFHKHSKPTKHQFFLTLGYFCIRAAFDPNPQDFNSYIVGDCLCPDNITGGECQPGYYCPEGSNGEYQPAYYCLEGSNRACYSLVTTRWSWTVFTFLGSLYFVIDYLWCCVRSEPTECEEGSYCATPALSVVTGPCDPGFYCARAASRADPTDGVTGDVCPRGRYCGKS